MASVGDCELLDIVGDLHEGVVDEHCWSRGLDRLSDMFGESRILLASLQPARPDVEVLSHRTAEMEYVGIIATLGSPQDNPWISVALSHPLRRLATIADVGEERLRASRVWREVYQPSGMEHSVGAVLDRLPNRIESCLFYRGSQAYDPAEQRRLGALIPHIARAWRVRRATQNWRTQAEAMASVLDRLDRGVIITGDTGEVRYANRAAERLMRKGDGIDATRGRLRAMRPRETDALAGVIDRAARTGIGRDSAAVDAVALSRADDQPPLAVVAEPLAPAHGERLGQSPGPGAILFIGDSAANGSPAPDRLRMVYALSAAEAQVAAQIATGAGIPAAARALGLTENTVKTHLKVVFDKVGVTRQGELVRRVIADVGGLADDGAHGPGGVPDSASGLPEASPTR